jgi:hypothetical protein
MFTAIAVAHELVRPTTDVQPKIKRRPEGRRQLSLVDAQYFKNQYRIV